MPEDTGRILKILKFIFSTCIRVFINEEPVTYMNKINFNICYYLTLDIHYINIVRAPMILSRKLFCQCFNEGSLCRQDQES